MPPEWITLILIRFNSRVLGSADPSENSWRGGPPRPPREWHERRHLPREVPRTGASGAPFSVVRPGWFIIKNSPFYSGEIRYDSIFAKIRADHKVCSRRPAAAHLRLDGDHADSWRPGWRRIHGHAR